MKVLIVEDEKKIAAFVRKGLEAQGSGWTSFAVTLKVQPGNG